MLKKGADLKSAPSPYNLVGAIGFEPTTPTMSRWCSNQLSYAPEECIRYLINRVRVKAKLTTGNVATSSIDGFRQPQITLLHVPNLVADSGRFLEFQVLGVLIHLFFQLFDLLCQYFW